MSFFGPNEKSFMANFEDELTRYTPDETMVLQDDPNIILSRLESVINLFKMEAMEARRKLFNLPEKYAGQRAWLEIRFGQWSNSFNKVLNIRIKRIVGIDPRSKCEAAKLKWIFLYWQTGKDLILSINSGKFFAFPDMGVTFNQTMDQFKDWIHTTTPDVFIQREMVKGA